MGGRGPIASEIRGPADSMAADVRSRIGLREADGDDRCGGRVTLEPDRVTRRGLLSP